MGVVILVDAPKISQVFRNLLSNAIKFTPRCGSIKVFTNFVELNDNQLSPQKPSASPLELIPTRPIDPPPSANGSAILRKLRLVPTENPGTFRRVRVARSKSVSVADSVGTNYFKIKAEQSSRDEPSTKSTQVFCLRICVKDSGVGLTEVMLRSIPDML